MSNMSYCRFQNTASDLVDCRRHLLSLDPEDTSYNTEAERDARRRILLTAYRMLEEVGVEMETDESELEALINDLEYDEREGED